MDNTKGLSLIKFSRKWRFVSFLALEVQNDLLLIGYILILYFCSSIGCLCFSSGCAINEA